MRRRSLHVDAGSALADWAGQLLINRTGTSSTWRVVLIMLVAGVSTALIGMNGAIAACRR